MSSAGGLAGTSRIRQFQVGDHRNLLEAMCHMCLIISEYIRIQWNPKEGRLGHKHLGPITHTDYIHKTSRDSEHTLAIGVWQR